MMVKEQMKTIREALVRFSGSQSMSLALLDSDNIEAIPEDRELDLNGDAQPLATAWYTDGLTEHLHLHTFDMLVEHDDWLHSLTALQAFVHPKERATGRYESFLDTSESVVADGFDSSKNSRGVQAVPIPRVVAHFPATGDEGLHRYAQAIASYAESAYIDLAAAAQCTKVDEEKAVGLDNNQRGGSISDGCSDSGDSLDDHRNPKAKKTRHKGRGNANRPAPPTINVATLTAHFVIDPQDILWFSHCEDVNVRTVDTAFESFLVRQKDELAISAEMAQTVGDELIRIIKHAVLRGVSVRHSFAHFDQQCKGYVDAAALVTGLSRLGIGLGPNGAEILVATIGFQSSLHFTVQDLEKFVQSEGADVHSAVRRFCKPGAGEKSTNQQRRRNKNATKEAIVAQDVRSTDGSETSEGSIRDGVTTNLSTTDDDRPAHDSDLSGLVDVNFLSAAGETRSSEIARDRNNIQISQSQGQDGSGGGGGNGGENYHNRGRGYQRDGLQNLGGVGRTEESGKISTLGARGGWSGSPAEGASVPSQDTANAETPGHGESRLTARARGLARRVVTNASLPHRLGQRSSQRLSREEAVAEGKLYDNTDNRQSEESFDMPGLQSSTSSATFSNNRRNLWLFENRQPFSSATMATLVDGCDDNDGEDSVPVNVATGNHRLGQASLNTSYQGKSRGIDLNNFNGQLNEWSTGNGTRRAWSTGVGGQDDAFDVFVDMAKCTTEEAKDTAANASSDELFHADYGVVMTWRFVKGEGERNTLKDRKPDPAAAARTATLKKTNTAVLERRHLDQRIRDEQKKRAFLVDRRA
jgi:hypothetical protein